MISTCLLDHRLRLEKTMKVRLAKGTFVLAILTAISWTMSSPAQASTTNYGTCQASTTYHAEQAPGQTGNGPMTTTGNSDVVRSAAFNGWVMCAS